jgi:hypothetical protein
VLEIAYWFSRALVVRGIFGARNLSRIMRCCFDFLELMSRGIGLSLRTMVFLLGGSNHDFYDCI